ncbi:hypothetical protein FKG94_14285 [Exilibacterium tricleocarpae]|uniref:Uncharacterized protein n=1 Tax=Exilibacterium tricleocarpae TaxID=2591008 RepID=A0A545TLX8_9GAMM|nr:hypothetical protein [Exilibacterium tricleocarpae]TQV78233.1 hypothetical protein FKG94_14285 [Exilibacterium tricleocarpae]
MSEPPSDSGNVPNAAAAKDMMLASVNQSIALAVQDATDLMRNIASIETTVIGIASAKWLAEPANVEYKNIIDSAKETITFSVENLTKVGENAGKVLSSLSK